MSPEKATKEGLKELDARLEQRKFLFRFILMGIMIWYGWNLYHTPYEMWRLGAGFWGLSYAAVLHVFFYAGVAAWIGRMKDEEAMNRRGFLSSWIYLFFLLGPLFLGARDISLLWFRMGFIIGYALVFAQFGTYFEYSRKTWMKA